MTTEELLLWLGSTAPTCMYMTPGFSPILRRRGIGALDGFTPKTDTEKALHSSLPGMFGDITPEAHRAFRKALHSVYLEQGYTPEELRHSFPEGD